MPHLRNYFDRVTHLNTLARFVLIVFLGASSALAQQVSIPVGHGGGAPGMNGMLRIYPASGYVVAVLSNLDPPAAVRVSQFLELRLER